MAISSSKVDALFSATVAQQSQLDGVSASVLSRGIDAFTSGDMDRAIANFRRSIALSPYSENTMKAFQLMAEAFKKQGKNDEAIKSWQQAARMYPLNDIPAAGLGDIYFSQKNYADAEKQYKAAIRLNPTESSNYYSLGQTYMSEGNYTDAEIQFKMVTQLKPQDPSGYYALGRNYRKMGQYNDAVVQLKKSLDVNRNLNDARLELGMTYADMNQTDDAKDQWSFLNNQDQSMAIQLQSYMLQKSAPKFVAAFTLSNFNAGLGPGSLSVMDSSFSAPNAVKAYAMNFIFSKDMDRTSVEKITNWMITRSAASDPGGAYNWGLQAKSDAGISPIPLSVMYNPDTLTATVVFTVSQNSSADATIDPQHILFKFSGLDSYGNTMDSSADQYSGISVVA